MSEPGVQPLVPRNSACTSLTIRGSLQMVPGIVYTAGSASSV